MKYIWKLLFKLKNENEIVIIYFDVEIQRRKKRKILYNQWFNQEIF